MSKKIREEMKTVMASGLFMPILMVGPSGVGKTYSVYEVAKQTGRELMRVNITFETDEISLIGGYELEDGSTKFRLGPVPTAMKEGKILLLDEIDLANPLLIMCLQPVLEGNPLYIKKTGETIYPSPGFSVIATANTKAQGSTQGNFVGTQVLNEAFIDRFEVVIDFGYMSFSEEMEVLSDFLKSHNKYTKSAKVNVQYLIRWANDIRRTYLSGVSNETISTRRLLTMMKYYVILGNMKESFEKALVRYEKEVQTAFSRTFHLSYSFEPETSELAEENDEEIEMSENRETIGNYSPDSIRDWLSTIK